MWYAKPSGSYTLMDDEAIANITEMAGLLREAGYTIEAQSGVIGNSYGESGLNPWRWQVDTVNYNLGYGLFQFTPARGRTIDGHYYPGYFSECTGLEGYAPNTSTSQVVSGASPSDGYCQTNVLITDYLGKWVSTCWRSYWDETEYPDLKNMSDNILNTYGNGSRLTQAQFANINNISAATFAFLACYEGPLVPNFNQRYGYACDVYAILSNTPPVPPTPPTPPSTRRGKLPIWMMCKKIH